MIVQSPPVALLPGIPVAGLPAAEPPHRLLTVGTLLLQGVRPGHTADLSDHLRQWGPPPEQSLSQLIAATEKAGLVGAGGAEFPTARKLSSVGNSRPGPVIVNGAEGETASRKDTVLLTHVPHLVLDGAVIAAKALGSKSVIVRIPASRSGVIATVAAASDTRRDRVRITISPGDDTFVAGEASAVVSSLQGGPAVPAPLGKPPVLRVGVRSRPVMLSNAETFARLALAARGITASSSLVTVSGAVRQPGVLEMDPSTPIGHILDLAGAGTDLAAVITGGWHGTWLSADPALLATPANRDSLRAVGGRWGAGAIIALPRDPCPVEVLHAVTDYLVGQGARQCGPCVLGLDAAQQDLRSSQPVIDRVRGRGLCGHPTATIAAIRSGQSLLVEELDVHRRGYCTVTQEAPR